MEMSKDLAKRRDHFRPSRVNSTSTHTLTKKIKSTIASTAAYLDLFGHNTETEAVTVVAVDKESRLPTYKYGLDL